MPNAPKPEDLQAYRRVLESLGARLRGDLDQMTDEALNRGGPEGSGAPSHVPVHMADLGTENFDQDLMLGMIENEQETLGLINAALDRIDAGTFGTCEECGGWITKTRLQAIPYASTCIECARKLEAH